jgi:hypothetical protein
LGEALYLDLKRMEMVYPNNNRRELERLGGRLVAFVSQAQKSE